MSAFGRAHHYPLEARTTSVLRPADEEPTHHRLQNPAGDLLVSLDYHGLTGSVILADGTPTREVEAAVILLRDDLEHARQEFVTTETTNVQAGVNRPLGTATQTIDEWVQELHRDLSATRDGRTPVEVLGQQSSDWGDT